MLRRRWLLIAGVMAVAVGLSVAFSVAATPQYASTARLFVSTSQGNTEAAYEGSLLSDQRALSYAYLMNSRDLAHAVIDELGVDLTADELMGKVAAEVVPDTVNINLTVKDPDPQQAQALAQGYANGLSDLVRDLETPPGETNPPIKLTVIDNASVPESTVSPKPLRNGALALVIGLLAGVAAAILRELMDTTVKSAEDLSAIDAPILGSIAFDSSTRTKPLITSLGSHAPRVEAFRVLRTNLQFVDVDGDEKVFVVSSAMPGEGKTTTSINLAIALAQAGQRTLLIEGDLRRPRASHHLGLDNSIGVTTVLLGHVTFDDAVQKHTESDLHVLSSGSIPPNPAELVQSKAMSELLDAARARYDVVIIDGPPLLPVTDAALLATRADGTLIVVRHGKTTKEQISQLADRLAQVDASAVGVVLNMVSTRSSQTGYGYGYGYAPVGGESSKDARKRRRREA
jgi:receptor protein-tyrosine kinase